MHLFLFICVCRCVYVCITCGMYDCGCVYVYIWYLYNCSLVGRDMCICIACPCMVVACVVCCVFACGLCSGCKYFCSMFIVFVVSEYYVYLQGFMKVCCICGGMCKNVRVQMHMCVICMCR